MKNKYGLPTPSLFYQRELLLPAFERALSKSWVKAGNCPFREKCEPERFYVRLDSGAFKCRSCGKYGRDIIGFRMQTDGADFRQALETVRLEWRIYP